jgi:hypothetical protein
VTQLVANGHERDLDLGGLAVHQDSLLFDHSAAQSKSKVLFWSLSLSATDRVVRLDLPPTEWSDWILEGMKPQVNGGCSLIISGHATVTSTLACVVASIVGKPLFVTAL